MEDRLIENKAFRVILMGVEEIVGKNALKSLLNYSGLTQYIDNIPPNNDKKESTCISETAKLDEAIEEIFGEKGARAILFQVGRMQAKYGLDENPDIARQALESMTGMSEPERARIILNYTADTISKQFDTESWIEEEEGSFLYKDKAGTHCFGRKADFPVCHTTAGFLGGLVTWAVGSNGWKVQETTCMAMGEPYCAFRIYKETAE
ncbi:MAG: 4-vinyl reductase [Deltaproteobacteria bacterium]|nr:4-vinyl reductase [Candidatus Zymogenaceae bacterium]